MTLTAARKAAADAIATEAAGMLGKGSPHELDAVNAEAVIRLATATAQSSELGDYGPATVIVTAPRRDAKNAIEVRVWTVTRDPVSLRTGPTGRVGRGLAVVDAVERALRGLTDHGLPDLQPATEPVTLPRDTQGSSVAIHRTVVLWPPAFPETDTAGVGSSRSAIRDHVAGIISTELPAALTRQRGRTEAERVSAYWYGDVPRAWVTLHTQRESIGGSPDFVERPSMEWLDSESPPRTWRAQAVTQTVVVFVHVAHRTEDLADEAILRISGQLTGSVVVWPGDFDARVLVGGVMVTQRLTGGRYELGRIDLLMADPAEWDAAAGLAVARLQFSVETVDPIEPATQAVQVTADEKEAGYVRFGAFGVGNVRRTEAATLADGQWRVEIEPTVGGSAQVMHLRVSPSRREPVETRWRDGVELVLGNPSAPTAVLEIMDVTGWNGATGTGTADVILLSGTLPSVGVAVALQVRDG